MAIALLVLLLTSALAADPTTPQAYKPEAIVLDPIARSGTSGQQTGLPPCGGRSRGPSHTLTEPGSLNPVVWEVIHPALDGNCTVRFAVDGANFQTMFPDDHSADANGKFACGRKLAYQETKSFQLPGTMTCDQCVIQWIWETYQGIYYQCSDLEVAYFPSVEQCVGRCKNGGVCVNNQCKCAVGFYGDFCQHAEENRDQSVGYIGYFVMFITFCAVLSLVSVGIYYYFNTHKLPPNVYQWLEKNCPWCIRKPGLLDQHERSEAVVVSSGGSEDIYRPQRIGDQRSENREVFRTEEVKEEVGPGGGVRRRQVTTTTTTTTRVSSSKPEYQIRVQEESQ